ncbi:hypothetical protein TRIUR3_01706 [Triticum urartu]|uniref:Uncharacterized protein n=1 Tax=Triticum urartu TaxID=4572 RepID=M7YIG0_TRIUA|nr:hypothetical protein TRIUR3_01706 [Triticum urartu]
MAAASTRGKGNNVDKTADQQDEKDTQPLRPPKLSHHAPSALNRCETSNTLRRGSDSDIVAARASPGVSPDTPRELDLGSLWSQIQQAAAASSSDVTSSSFSPRPWNSLRIKKLSWSLGTLHLFSTVQLLHSERNLKIQVKKRKILPSSVSAEKATIINTYAVMKSGMKDLDESGNNGAISSQKAQKRLMTAPLSPGTMKRREDWRLLAALVVAAPGACSCVALPRLTASPWRLGVRAALLRLMTLYRLKNIAVHTIFYCNLLLVPLVNTDSSHVSSEDGPIDHDVDHCNNDSGNDEENIGGTDNNCGFNPDGVS